MSAAGGNLFGTRIIWMRIIAISVVFWVVDVGQQLQRPQRCRGAGSESEFTGNQPVGDDLLRDQRPQTALAAPAVPHH